MTDFPQVTASFRKLVAGLDKARTRREEHLFKAEGTKCVLDTIGAFRCEALLASDAWIGAHAGQLPAATPLMRATRADLERMTHFSTAPEVIAVYRLPEAQAFDPAVAGRELVVALDRVQDPGNLGTIARICDWFGVHSIVASSDTADIYSPKAVQATMGALSRVKVYYGPLPALLAEARRTAEVAGTFLGGDNLFTAPLPRCGVVVLGNEGSGISLEVEATVTRRLTIPSYPAGAPTGESLNVGMAAAITLAEFRRRALS